MPTTTYQPDASGGQDATVRSTHPSINYPAEQTLAVHKTGPDEARAFVKFDVPNKAGYNISTATLTLYVSTVNSTVGDITQCSVYAVGSQWDETTITWNEQPLVSGAQLDAVSIVGVGTVSFNVTLAVQGWANGTVQNNGFRLSYIGVGNGQDWLAYSSDYSIDPTRRPKLTVVYTQQAPNAPSVGTGNFPATEDHDLTWTYSHDDPNSLQTAYQVQVQRISDSTIVYDSSKTTSSAESVTLPANTLANDTNYQYRVATWGPNDTAGPWSAYSPFNCAARPLVDITAPISGDVVGTASAVVSWTYSDTTQPQASFNLKLYDVTDGQVLVFDSGTVSGAATQYELTGLASNTEYEVDLVVTNAAGVSNVIDAGTQILFNVVTVPPPSPDVTLYSVGDQGVIRLIILNPAAGSGQLPSSYNEVYRRITNSGDPFERIATNLPLNYQYDDRTVSSGQSYDYEVLTWSADNTYSGTVVTGSVTLYGVWVHDPTDVTGPMMHFFYDGAGRDEQWIPEVELLRFAGRNLPIAEFGVQTRLDTITANLQLASGDRDRSLLTALARKRTIVHYRDGQGRNTYAVITNLSIRDQKFGGLGTVKFDAVDYTPVGV